MTELQYLLFHTLAELFAVVVAFGVFVVAWNTRRYARASFFLVAGLGFAVVGGLDLLHTLAYKGMGLFPGDDADLPTQLWIAARYTEVTSVLVGVALARRAVSPDRAAGLALLWAAVLGAAIFWWDVFPVCYAEGQGLTPFKIGSEYLIIALKAATAALLLLRPEAFDAAVRRTLIGYLAISALSEMAFTSYIGVYDGVNQLGHVLKVVAYAFLYKATVRAALVTPYAVLFRDLQAARDNLEATVAERTAALASANRTLDALFAASPLAIMAMDLEGRVTLWNPAAERLFGWTAAEVVGGRLPTADSSERPYQSATFARVLGGQAHMGLELERRRKDGSTVAVRSFSAPLYGEDGVVCGLMSMVADISAEHEAQRAVRSREERLRGVMDNVPDAILTVSEQGVIETCNRAAEHLFGYQAGELIGRRVETLMPADMAEDHRRYMREYVAGGPPRLIGRGPREVTAVRKDGGVIVVDLGLNQMTVDGRRLFIGVLRDVGERVRARQQHEAMQLELQRSQRMEALGNLAGGIAHEVNNMLMPVLGLTEVAMRRLPDDSPARANLEMVAEAATRASAILRQILTFSRVEKLSPTPMPLANVLGDACALLRASAPASVTIRLDQPAEPLAVMGTPLEMHQVIMNLGNNAVHALEGRGGTVAIRFRRCGPGDRPPDAAPDRAPDRATDWAVVEVVDDGVGMDPAELDRIFQPFYTTKPVGVGSGMGLAVVHGIVAGWNGGIAVESAPGQGTTFRIFLPLAEGADGGRPVEATAGASA